MFGIRIIFTVQISWCGYCTALAIDVPTSDCVAFFVRFCCFPFSHVHFHLILHRDLMLYLTYNEQTQWIEQIENVDWSLCLNGSNKTHTHKNTRDKINKWNK